MATPEATDRFGGTGYRGYGGGEGVLTLSKLGVGTYLGDADDLTDAAYVDALETAFELGCNVVDTASNYRHGRSERCVGDAVDSGALDRDEVFVSSKAGYIPFDDAVPDDPHGFVQQRYVEPGFVDPEDVVDSKCISPGFLENQLDRSLDNLDLESIDLYYLHNPECHLKRLPEDEFYGALREAFGFLEREVDRGRVSGYGVATWTGFRVPDGDREHLSMERVVEAAGDASDGEPALHAVQMPYNGRMDEARDRETQNVDGVGMSALDAADELGLYVFGSASLMQGEFARGRTRDEVHDALQRACGDGGVETALFGSSNAGHVEMNLGLLEA